MFQKVLVIASMNGISFGTAYLYGQIAGMIGSLQERDEGILLSDGQITCLTSSFVFVTYFGMGLAAVVSDKIGRRWPFVIFSVPIIANYVILYYASAWSQFILSRIIAGVSVGVLITLNIMVTPEYTSPESRALFLNMVSTASPAFGYALSHALGIVFHWRVVVLIGIIPTSLGVLLPPFWVESPHWLASRGKTKECEISFRKLHGSGVKSERELQLLIKIEKSKMQAAEQSNSRHALKKLVIASKRRYFWKLILLSCSMYAYFAATGKVIFITLATVILETIAGSSNVLLFTLLVDGFAIIGSCLSCYLIRKTSMRTLLFSTGFIANGILVVLSACFYFKTGEIFYNWVNVGLLACYFIMINTGPCPMVEALTSEIFPLEIKLYMFFLSGTVLTVALSATVSLLPHILNTMGYHGLFLLNAAIMSLCLGYMWIQLPETKGMTLQEIELYFKTNNLSLQLDEDLSDEQIKKALI